MGKGGGGFGTSWHQRTAGKGTFISKKAEEFSQFLKETTGHAQGWLPSSPFERFLTRHDLRRAPKVIRKLWWKFMGPATIYWYKPEARALLLDLMEKHKILKPNSRIVSLCSAQGLFELYVGKKFPNSEIICVDFTARLIGMGENFAKKLKIKNVKFLNTDAQHTKIPSNSQDIVMIAFVVPRGSEASKMLVEAKRFLDNKKTTYLVIAWPGPIALGILASRRIEEMGFKNIVLQRISFPEPTNTPNLAIFKLGARNAASNQ